MKIYYARLKLIFVKKIENSAEINGKRSRIQAKTTLKRITHTHHQIQLKYVNYKLYLLKKYETKNEHIHII